MSSWPPPQQPLPQGQPAANRPHAPQPNKGGCGQALLLTAVLMAISIGIVLLFTDDATDFMPVLEESVAVVRVEGPITDSSATVKLIKRMRESKLITAIVLRLETPGGGVGASEEIYREALKASTENNKLVVASMGDVAASGGYYIAAAADHIYATSGTITPKARWVRAEILQREGKPDQAATDDGNGADPADVFAGRHSSARRLLGKMVRVPCRDQCRTLWPGRHRRDDHARSNVVDAHALAGQFKREGTCYGS